jgi:hypothetical protein
MLTAVYTCMSTEYKLWPVYIILFCKYLVGIWERGLAKYFLEIHESKIATVQGEKGVKCTHSNSQEIFRGRPLSSHLLRFKLIRNGGLGVGWEALESIWALKHSGNSV